MKCNCCHRNFAEHHLKIYKFDFDDSVAFCESCHSGTCTEDTHRTCIECGFKIEAISTFCCERCEESYTSAAECFALELKSATFFQISQSLSKETLK